MNFIDECQIKLKAGRGGNGIISFRREARVSKGGPDGGDGGNGGSVFFKGNYGLNTLVRFTYNKQISGNDGLRGRNKNQHGRNGKDITISVPVGTIVTSNDLMVADITNDTDEILIAKGGHGGNGNTHFKSSKNVAPKISENGVFGESFELKLELKLLGDIALVGLPSAGKSTLLNTLTNAKSKVGNFDFTTLTPVLGKVESHKYIIVDLPGIIKDASQGKGLGFQFLKHASRSKIIAHVIDFGIKNKSPIDSYEIIYNELTSYDDNFKNKAQFIIANKSDLPNFEKNLSLFTEKYPDLKIIKFSNVDPWNIEEIVEICEEYLKVFKPKVVEEKLKKEITIKYEEALVVKKLYNGAFDVTGKEVYNIFQRIPLDTFENTQRFYYKLQKLGLWEELNRLKINSGDQVQVFGHQFTWSDTILAN